MNPDDIDNIYDVGWADGNSLDIRSGELKGYIDVRDGNEGVNGSPIYKGIPYYEKKINQFARTFAMSFNEGFIDVNSNGVVDFGEDRVGHADGYTLDAPAAAVTPSGIRFFTMTGNNGMPLDKDEFLNGAVTNAEIYDKYKNINAKNLSVSDEVINSPEAISVSDAPAQTGNIVNLNALLAARHDTHMFSEGGPEDFMKSLIASLGIDSQMASRLSDSHESMVRQVDTQRMADSGVSIDEEMANLIKYQHAYNASAKMIETMSEIYDTLINRIGL
jgi:flagellar hook-associated protein 1 FlgK